MSAQSKKTWVVEYYTHLPLPTYLPRRNNINNVDWSEKKRTTTPRIHQGEKGEFVKFDVCVYIFYLVSLLHGGGRLSIPFDVCVCVCVCVCVLR